MKRTILALGTILVVFVALFAVLVLRPVSKVKAQAGCSNGTLFGDYGITISQGDQNGEPHITVALVDFDGSGGISFTEVWDASKFQLSGPGTGTGTYAVNSDCSMSFAAGTKTEGWGTILEATGGEVDGEVYTPSTSTTSPNAKQGTFSMKKVWSFQGCSNGTLSGDYEFTFSMTQEGPTGGPIVISGLAQFNGSGGLSATEVWRASEFQLYGPSTGTATYVINPDCSMTFTSPGQQGYGVVVNAPGGQVNGIVFSPSTTSAPTAPNAIQGNFTIKKAWGFE